VDNSKFRAMHQRGIWLAVGLILVTMMTSPATYASPSCSDAFRALKEFETTDADRHNQDVEALRAADMADKNCTPENLARADRIYERAKAKAPLARAFVLACADRRDFSRIVKIYDYDKVLDPVPSDLHAACARNAK